jgi:hypothetical protein
VDGRDDGSAHAVESEADDLKDEDAAAHQEADHSE